MPTCRFLVAAACTAAVLLAPSAAHAKAPPRAAAAQACPNTDVLPTPDDLEVVRAALVCLHNQVRAQHGLPSLKDNLKLRKAAGGHSSDMVDEGYFDHTAPDGETFVDRILGAGYAKRTDGWTLGENIAFGTDSLSTPAGVMDAWMSSPGHRANILRRSYKEIGVGIRLGTPSDASTGATITTEFGARQQ